MLFGGSRSDETEMELHLNYCIRGLLFFLSKDLRKLIGSRVVLLWFDLSFALLQFSLFIIYNLSVLDI
jgi:hypothetical protein